MSATNEPGDGRIAAFAARAREYVALIDRAEQILPFDLLQECMRTLPHLYAGALALPDTEVTDSSEPELASPLEKLLRLLGPVDDYWMVFDPYEKPDGDMVGSIADDLAATYLDLGRPLADYDAGAIGDAVWAWRFNVQVHAGQHMLGALHAIHWIVHSYGWPEKPTDNVSPDEEGQP